jgi:asparagine synthase (glutamine-hydrolysing)
MCGIAGQLRRAGPARDLVSDTKRALATLRHRGPDQFGIYSDDACALGSARLSIVDIGGGQQPIANEDERYWVVFNGEIFNHVELRAELEARGHRFATHSDTEVILHLYEELGPQCLNRFNGQFAIAIWDRREKTLFLGRDRLGVRPLFYTQVNGRLLFASEIKALLTDPEVTREIDPIAIDQIFTFWSPLSPRTAFRDIKEVPPGHYLLSGENGVEIKRYWQIAFREKDQKEPAKSFDECVEEFRALLTDAVRIRLRADVPVSAYLSGGLDSSTIASIIRNFTSTPLETFSIAFADVHFDESEFQIQMAKYLGTDHHVVKATHADIGRIFPEVIWHTEVPVLRTSPAPMFLLSKLTRDHGFKVALTGEGADEFLAGYDIFKEARIRRFWARQPESKWRSALLQKLYPEIPGLAQSKGSFLTAFFKTGLGDVGARDYSHSIRWRNTRRACRFFSEEFCQRTASNAADPLREVHYPPEFERWGPLERAQYLEIEIFLSEYLLCSQGDRMGMAHSVEGRFPFLDYRVVEYCCQLPSRYKLKGLTEKHLLRKAAEKWLPPEIAQRRKRPYRAPIHKSFFNDSTPDYVRELLSEREIKRAGIFNPQAVAQLVAKIEAGKPIGETDDMAIAGIISTQLFWSEFLTGSKANGTLEAKDDVKVCLRSSI